jgi:hypothetical protein
MSDKIQAERPEYQSDEKFSSGRKLSESASDNGNPFKLPDAKPNRTRIAEAILCVLIVDLLLSPLNLDRKYVSLISYSLAVLILVFGRKQKDSQSAPTESHPNQKTEAVTDITAVKESHNGNPFKLPDPKPTRNRRIVVAILCLLVVLSLFLKTLLSPLNLDYQLASRIGYGLNSAIIIMLGVIAFRATKRNRLALVMFLVLVGVSNVLNDLLVALNLNYDFARVAFWSAMLILGAIALRDDKQSVPTESHPNQKTGAATDITAVKPPIEQKDKAELEDVAACCAGAVVIAILSAITCGIAAALFIPVTGTVIFYEIFFACVCTVIGILFLPHKDRNPYGYILAWLLGAFFGLSPLIGLWK